MCRGDKWPSPGETLPVEVERGEPTKLKVLWEEVPSSADSARQQAEQMAEAMRTGQQPGAGAFTSGDVTVQEIDASSNPELYREAVAAAEQATGMDLDGDGKVGSDSPPAGGQDPTERLRELAKLRDEGILTEEEFAAQKAKLLGRM
jgi:hypothetical protein